MNPSDALCDGDMRECKEKPIYKILTPEYPIPVLYCEKHYQKRKSAFGYLNSKAVKL